MNQTLVLFAVACIPWFMGADDAADWTEYSPPDGSFHLLFPSSPAEVSVPATPAGAHTLVAEVGTDDALRLVLSYQDIPQSIRTIRQASDFAAGVESGWLKTSGAKLARSSEIWLGTIPGREVVAEGGTVGKPVRMRTFTVRNRSYQLTALSLGGNAAAVESEAAMRFFDSFRVANLPENILADDREYPDPTAKLQRIAGGVAAFALVAAAIIWVVVFAVRKQSQERPRNPA